MKTLLELIQEALADVTAMEAAITAAGEDDPELSRLRAEIRVFNRTARELRGRIARAVT